RNVPLVVIEGYYQIKLAVVHAVKDGIGRNRAGNVETFALSLAYSGCNFLGLLISKQPVFSCVRIQACYSNARVRNAKLFERPHGIVDGIQNAFPPDGVQSSAQT